jgi:hypothetical protein
MKKLIATMDVAVTGKVILYKNKPEMVIYGVEQIVK